MKIKYQIFISSTYEDLKEVREQLIKCILEMGHIPVGMEMFSAANEDQWRVIQKQIDDCDFYMVVMAHRYGSMDKDVSFTEKEFDYAVSKDLPVLGFVIDDGAKWAAKYIDSDEAIKQKLLKFKEKVKSRMVNFWKNSEDIYGKAAIALNKAISTYDRPGYIRGDEIADKNVYQELTRLSTENSNLRKELNDTNRAINNEEERKETELLAILESNKRDIPIRFKGNSDWEYGFKVSLLEMFESFSERLLIESDELEMKKALALKASGRIGYDKDHPVPTNRFAEWLADLHALKLIEPSRRNHSVADTSKYWALTQLGQDFSSNLRRLKLMKGLPTATDKKEEDNKE